MVSPQHVNAQYRLVEILEAHGYLVIHDIPYVLQTKRFGNITYYPDVYASGKREIWIEVDGKVGHSSSRSYDNRETRKRECNRRGIEFYEFSTGEIVGGYRDSKGKKHKPHSSEFLIEALHLKNNSDNAT